MSLPTMQGDICIALRIEVCMHSSAAYACVCVCVVYSIFYFYFIPI